MSMISMELIEISGEENVLSSGLSLTIQNKVSDPVQREQREALANLLEWFLRFAYVTFAFPYPRAEGHIIWKILIWIQKIVCAILDILVVIQAFAYVRQSLQGEKKFKEHPTLYVDFGFFSSNLIYVLITIKRLWFNQNDFNRITTFIQNEDQLPVRSSPVTTLWFVGTLFVLRVVVKLGIWTYTGFDVEKDLSKLSRSYIFRRLVSVGNYNFFLSASALDAPPLRSITSWDRFLGILAGAGKFAGFFRFEMYIGLMLVYALQLWICSSQLRRNIENSQNIGQDWHNIYRQFQSLQVLSALINQAIEDMMLWYIISVASGYSIYIHGIFIFGNYVEKYNVISSIAVCITTLVVFATSWKQILKAKELVRRARNRRQIPQDEANNFLDDPVVGLMNPGTVFKVTLMFVCAFALGILNFVFITKEDNPSRKL